LDVRGVERWIKGVGIELYLILAKGELLVGRVISGKLLEDFFDGGGF